VMIFGANIKIFDPIYDDFWPHHQDFRPHRWWFLTPKSRFSLSSSKMFIRRIFDDVHKNIFEISFVFVFLLIFWIFVILQILFFSMIFGIFVCIFEFLDFGCF
jgi:hypothetical protein